MRFVPAIAALDSETGAKFEAGRRLPDIFHVACAKPRTPVERCGRGNDGEGLDRALQERLQCSEGGLTVLVLREVVVALEFLDPSTDFDLVAAEGPVDVVVEGEKIARYSVVVAHVAAGAGDLRSAVRRGGAGDNDGAHRTAAHEAGNVDCSRAQKIERCPGIAEACRVEQARREDVLFFNAGDLLTQCFVDDREGVGRGGVRSGIIDGVDPEEEIFCADVIVGARGAEVFTNGLLRVAESTGDAGGLAGGRIR